MRCIICASGMRGSGKAHGDSTACTTQRPSVVGVAAAARLFLRSVGNGDFAKGSLADSLFAGSWRSAVLSGLGSFAAAAMRVETYQSEACRSKKGRAGLAGVGAPEVLRLLRGFLSSTSMSPSAMSCSFCARATAASSAVS